MDALYNSYFACKLEIQNAIMRSDVVACNKNINCFVANCTDILDRKYFPYATRNVILRKT